MKTIYRYEIEYKTVDSETSVHLREYPVVKETEHTYFIALPTYTSFAKKLKQVKKNAYNTFAYSTKEKAKEHFIRRTSRRILWFQFWIAECKKGLKLIEKI